MFSNFSISFVLMFFLKPFRASLIGQLVKNLPAMQETPVQFLGQKISWRGDRLPTPVFLSFPGGSVGKESACHVGDLGSILGWKDHLEKGTATHSGILAWRIPRREEPGRLQRMGSQRVGHDFHFFFLKPLSNIVEKLLYTYINNTYYTYIIENLWIFA